MVDHWTWCRYTIPGEVMGIQPSINECTGREYFGRLREMSVPMGGGWGFWPIALGVLPYRGPLETIFYIRFPFFLPCLGRSPLAFFVFAPFWDERGVIFGGGARQGCSVCNILCRFMWGVTVPVSQHTRSRYNPPPPPPLPYQGSLGNAHARQRRGVSLEEKYLFSIPR